MHGFFQFTSGAEAGDAKLLELQGGSPEPVVEPSVRDLCRTRLFGLVGDVLSGSSAQAHKKGAGEAAEPAVEVVEEEPGVDVVAELLRACHQAERAKAVVTPVCALDDHAQGVRKDVRAVLKELERLAQDGTSPRLESAVNLVRVLLLYQLATPAEFTSDIEDLPRSLRAAFGAAAAEAPAGKGEPHHMDVLVDSLLSMVSKPHALIRDVAEKVVKAFSGDITHKGIRRMMSQLTRATDSRRGRTSRGGGSDGDEEDEDTDDADASDDDDSSEEEEEDGAAEEDSEDAEAPPRAAAGGEPASDSDVEDAADAMDDAAMLKSDVMLSAVLREAKKDRVEKKTAAESVLHFKFRVLSLVEAFVKSQLSSPLLSARARVPATQCLAVLSDAAATAHATGDGAAPPAGARHVRQRQRGGPGHPHRVADHQLHQQGACGRRSRRARAAAVQHVHRLHAPRLRGLHAHGDARLSGGGHLRAAPHRRL